jgi:hypothetical protein
MRKEDKIKFDGQTETSHIFEARMGGLPDRETREYVKK